MSKRQWHELSREEQLERNRRYRAQAEVKRTAGAMLGSALAAAALASIPLLVLLGIIQWATGMDWETARVLLIIGLVAALIFGAAYTYYREL